MTRTRNAINGLLALLLAACFALSGLVISRAEDAAQDQLLYVVQLIVGTADPTTVSGSYGLVPDEVANPMPTDKDGKTVNVFDLTGNSTKTASFHFTEPGVYQYTAGKLKDSTKPTFTAEDFEEGTKDYPLTHVFGFKVNRRADGSLEVIPYTCEDNQATFFTDGRGMTLWNYVKADAPAEPTTKKDEPTTKEEEPTTAEEEPTTAKEEPTTAKE
ncbi:MAG: hypothetical protein IJ547_02915, partial [Clostridia bacterium]|nr:hypothetical protein [Clostridia bacterium]